MEFVFVNVQKPSDALQLAKESQIRSHVTRLQWKNQSRQAVQEEDITTRSGRSSNTELCVIGNASVPAQIGGLRNDPFNSYPIAAQPWTALLVDHCKSPLSLMLRY